MSSVASKLFLDKKSTQSNFVHSNLKRFDIPVLFTLMTERANVLIGKQVSNTCLPKYVEEFQLFLLKLHGQWTFEIYYVEDIYTTNLRMLIVDKYKMIIFYQIKPNKYLSIKYLQYVTGVKSGLKVK